MIGIVALCDWVSKHTSSIFHLIAIHEWIILSNNLKGSIWPNNSASMSGPFHFKSNSCIAEISILALKMANYHVLSLATESRILKVCVSNFSLLYPKYNTMQTHKRGRRRVTKSKRLSYAKLSGTKLKAQSHQTNM